ncbi:MAG TPA: hypothetical protein VNO35_10265 [Steroidobacteraceae bacterium]|nr:hypothetical protein [Steroidobacteraceae bacterium]
MAIRNRLLLGGLLALISLTANADLPGKHPYYLHALSDLRAARWMLEHRPGDAAVSGQEDTAIVEIDAAIGEIKHAAIDDGKDIHDHPPVEGPKDRPGRLHKALELLRKVHSDVAREEDDPMVKGLRDRAVGHIDGAIHATELAVRDVRQGR